MCPTTRADIDKARPMYGVKSKESLARKISMAQGHFAAAASSCQLSIRMRQCSFQYNYQDYRYTV